jgi:hypothetical protein
LFPFPWPTVSPSAHTIEVTSHTTPLAAATHIALLSTGEPGFCKRWRHEGLVRSDLVLELVALDDGIGARDGVAAGGPEVERARVALGVPVHAAEGGAAPACEPCQAHALPAARAPRSRRRRRRGRGVGMMLRSNILENKDETLQSIKWASPAAQNLSGLSSTRPYPGKLFLRFSPCYVE